MPTYPYHCLKCEIEFETFKSIKEYDGKDKCPSCGNVGQRIFVPVVFTGEKVQHAEFNPAFGKVIKNAYHRSEEAKKLNMIEIGNEKAETVHKHFDQARETKRKRGWDEL